MDKLTVFEYSLKNRRFSYIQDKLIEEMSELIQAIMKAREIGENHSVDIEKEYADVNLMMQQIRYCYDFKTDNLFSERVEIYEQLKCNKLWSIWHDGIIPEENK